MKSQIPIFNDQNRFGILKLGTRPQGGSPSEARTISVIVICLEFVICYLEFLVTLVLHYCRYHGTS